MKIKVTEYEPTGKPIWVKPPAKVIKTWLENIPDSSSNFFAADYIGKKYPKRVLGIIVL